MRASRDARPAFSRPRVVNVGLSQLSEGPFTQRSPSSKVPGAFLGGLAVCFTAFPNSKETLSHLGSVNGTTRNLNSMGVSGCVFVINLFRLL